MFIFKWGKFDNFFQYTLYMNKRLKKETDEKRKLCILYKLLYSLWYNFSPSSLVYKPLKEFSWEEVQETLEYYSDRWDSQRLHYMLIQFEYFVGRYEEKNDSVVVCKGSHLLFFTHTQGGYTQ